MKLYVGLFLLILGVPNLLFSQSISAQITAQGDISCFGLDNGYVTISTTGGNGPYTYELDGSGIFLTNNTLNSLGPGNHIVRVRDAGFGFTDVSFLIQEPLPLQLSVVDKKEVKCFGENTGEITLASNGGTGSHEYAVDQNAFTSSPSFKFLPAGPYNVKVRDQNSCITDSAVFISSSQKINTFSNSKKNATCKGDADGEIQLGTTGGWGEYRYSLDSINFQPQPSFNSLPSGNYQVFTVDSAGCSGAFSFSIQEPDSLVHSFTYTDVSCFGQDNGTINLLGSGGSEPYFYSIDGFGFKSTHRFSQLSPGEYGARIKDINGCESALVPVQITQPSKLDLMVSTRDILCQGGIDGSASLNVQGGTRPYSISWADDPALNDSSRNDLAAGNYLVIVEDANGCSETSFFSIEEPDSSISLSILEVEATSCGLSNGSISLGTSSASLPVNYKWSHNSSLNDSDARVLEAGTYLIEATDAQGCNANISIEVPQGPRVVAGFQTFPELGTTIVAAQGEIKFINTSRGGSSYRWNFGDGIGIANSKDPVYTYPNPGAYNIQLIVTDDMGTCADTISKQVLIQMDEWIDLPDAFSPNEDGINDSFIPVGSGIESFEITFFDKWGRKIKEQTSLHDAWDGRDRNGKLVRPGVYAYKMKVIFISGFVLERAGGLTLLR